jgi:hypothetical protein
MMLQNANAIQNNHQTNVNNYTTIVELGKENLMEVFSQDQQMNVLGKRYKCLDYLIETVHFSDQFKQFQNIAITNANNGFAYKYDDKEQCFVMVNKDELLKDIMSYRMEDICDFFENCKAQPAMNAITVNSVQRFIDDMGDDKKKQEKIRDIRLIVYNHRDKMKSLTA